MTSPQDSEESPTPPSLLDQIIQTSHQESMGSIPAESNTDSSSPALASSGTQILDAKKARDPMTAGTVLKLIGTLLLISVIFFGSFLAYIAFNPNEAVSFMNIFGISQKDVAYWLWKFIFWSFSLIFFILSTIWLISLFRAIWTPKEQKRHRLLRWLSAVSIGLFIFGAFIPFWFYLYKTVNATDYVNPGGDVTIYDNDLYTHPESLKFARIVTTKNLIGPITLKYDLSTNAKAVAKKNILTIESYEINFDGAKCANNESVLTGADPSTEQGLICTFDQVRTYNIRGTYSGKDRLGAPTTINIPLDTVEVKGLLDISTNTNTNGNKIVTINASKIKHLGNPRWLHSTPGSEEEARSSITETVSSTPLIVCLMLLNTECDRYFIIADSESNAIDGSILFELDSANTLGVSMSLTGSEINNNEIIDINWIEVGGARLCQGSTKKCEYAFLSYGTKKIEATIVLANTKRFVIRGTITLSPPLTIIRHVQVKDLSNSLLNTPDTFDSSVGAYIIQDLNIPMKITLDARDVILENPGYKMQSVRWQISDGDSMEERNGEKIDFEIPKTARYTIKALYTFEKTIATTDAKIRTTQDMIILDLERKTINPSFRIQQSSDYVPAKVTVDASSSTSKNGKLQKFIFDFDEGRPPAEGDAIQTYEYHTPREKKITLKVIDDNNEQATISKYIILKDTPKTIAFSTSMSPGFINTAVDFIADGATGQIEEYIWNFGDNTPIIRGYEATHTFKKAGSYTVTLTVRYIDGTEKFTTQSFRVDEALE